MWGQGWHGSLARLLGGLIRLETLLWRVGQDGLYLGAVHLSLI